MTSRIVDKEPGPRTRGYLAWVLSHGRTLWLVAVLFAVPALARTASLYANLNSDFEALLPKSAESVKAIEELRARVIGLQYLAVVVDTKEPENIAAGERFLDDLAARIRTYPPDMVRAVRTGNAEERAFLERFGSLYLSLDDLREMKRRIEVRRDWEVARATGSSLEEEESEPPRLDFSDIEAKYRASTGETKLRNGRFSSAEERTTLLLVEVARFSTGSGHGGKLLTRVEHDIAALGGPERYAPGMRVGYAGDVAISVEELSALMADLLTSGFVVALLVGAVVILYFRTPRALLAIFLPLSVATVLAFALASLPPLSVTSLNSNTAFLGSIIVGNGINPAIMLTARFVEERRSGMALPEALARAVRGCLSGTLTAALAASIAYGSLVLTDFRGFRQFGFIGGVGMLLAWGLAFLLTPPLLAWLDRGASWQSVNVENRPAERVARAVRAHAFPIVGAALGLTILAATLATRIDDSWLERDFANLRRADTWTQGEGYWGRRMDRLFGTYLTPIAILADDESDADRIATRMKEEIERGSFGEILASVRSARDVLPRDQEEKIGVVEEIREMMTPRLRAAVEGSRRSTVDRLVEGEPPHPIGFGDLPRTFTTGLRELDGRVGRIVLVYPRPSKALWQGPTLTRLVDGLRTVATESVREGRPPARVASSLSLSQEIVEAIRKDGVLTSVAALAGVVLVVLALVGRGRIAALVVGALIAGVLWMVGADVALRVKINFSNFIALPITFGIGVEYAVNVVTRYEQDGRDTRKAILGTGGAVALCSATTIIGYGSLLLAQNRALFLFGLLAVVGEITCLLVAVVALPALLEVLGRRPRSAPAPSESG